ncbi:MAG: alpha-amylase family protein [Planctomycetota bacterium]
MQPHKVQKSPIRCSAAELVASRFRQIHLDFHTSPLIPDVGAEFDPDVFAETLAEARVNWVTLFAKCHHGMSYYPTKAGTRHPTLKSDLLGRQVEACRKRGIVTPAYISVRVDEHNAHLHPEWIGRLKENKVWKWGDALAAGWYNLCMNHPAYVEELAAQAVEVLKWYDVEGIFFDMCYNPDPGCYCPRCFDAMRRLGLDFSSDADHRKYEYILTRKYTRRLAQAVRAVKPEATLFFNGRMRPDIRGELDVYSHVEIEALPTGGWGYAFFPIHARYARVLPRPLQGMTARFHKSWADFGGLKTGDQLLYEAGTILAATAVANVGDQCHPRGVLDKGAYQVIGTAFKHIEACEPWCVGAKPAAEVAVMMLLDPVKGAEYGKPSGISNLTPAVDGAGRMLLELKQQFDLIYPDTPLARYRLVVLPDSGVLDAAAQKKLAAFLKRGGAVLASHEATLRDGAFTCPGLPVKYAGANPFKPCYLDLGAELGKTLPESRFVFYEDSAQVQPAAGAQALGHLVTSYFNRAYDHFCSHNQTPYDKQTSCPVAVAKGSVAYLAPAVFKAYREHAYPVYKAIVARLLERLLPEPLVRVNAPSAMEVSVNRQAETKRLVVHLVNFQPQRRHANVEWIEELYPVRDIALALRTGKEPSAVYLAPQKTPLPFRMKGGYCEVTVPEVKAHQMVVLEGC